MADDYIVKDKNDTLRVEENVPPRPPGYYPRGISISNDSVKFFLGIWKKIDEEYQYLGEYRTYKITGDSIKFFNLNEIKPTKQYRFEIKSKDTLPFYINQDDFETYIKFETKISNYYQLDSIKAIITDGWGKHNEYFITSEGLIRFTDYYSDSPEKIVEEKGKVSTSIFKGIEERYNWAGFMDLGDYSGCCDGNQVEIKFFSKGKEIKSIIDYENSSPMRFIWANVYFLNLIESNIRWVLYGILLRSNFFEIFNAGFAGVFYL